jgi:hypothetical protein
MRNKRFLAFVAAGLGVIALVPVANAVGEGGDGKPGRSIEAATALGTSFTYQGRLTDAGSPANGVYDLRFILYDAETAGAAVGSTQSKEDVAVTNGLFSVDLDFGAAAFNGDARWVEIAVRPGSSSGTHTVLSPRQPVSPTPYALFAKAAAGIAVPFAATGTLAGAPASTTGLFTVTQTGTGIGVASNRTTTDPAVYPALLGTNAGGGAGVQGESTYVDGVAVQGFAIGANGIGGNFSGPTGIQVDGPIKVSGDKSAFVHLVNTAVSGGNTCAGDTFTIIDNPAINGDANAILFITSHHANQSSATGVDGLAVVYDSSACVGANDKWAIVTDNGAGFPNGTLINVLVIKQ